MTNPKATPLFSLCIGRQLGAGGRTIAQRLAAHYGAAYYDKQLLKAAAVESGFSAKLFEQHDEKRSFFSQVIHAFKPLEFATNFYSSGVDSASLFQLQSAAIEKAAAKESCVFVGRAADYVLRNDAAMISVFITADTADRIARVMALEGCDETVARHTIEKADQCRADFYNFFTNKEWGAASSYDLCLNSSKLGVDGSYEIIKAFIDRKLEL